ncbi:MAG: HTH domain-containing protein, partial [Actinomycetota bacterium]
MDTSADDSVSRRAVDPTGRVLELLSLLQSHRRWTSPELAERLGITVRTVRRDIDRLRTLGYPVDAAPGAAGGYRLAAGTHLPPLLFDDDEAVAIGVGLLTATTTPLAGIETTALRALAKLETLLPDRLRRRLTAINAAASVHRWGDASETVEMESLTSITTACRDREELRFE